MHFLRKTAPLPIRASYFSSRTLLACGLSLGALLFPEISHATCTWVNTATKQPTPARTFDFNYTLPATIAVPRDTPAGTVIASTSQTINGQLAGLKCSQTTVNYVAGAAQTKTSTDSILMESGVYGIEFRLTRTYSTPGFTPENLKWNVSDNIVNDRIFDQNNLQYTLELVKTAAYPAGGDIAPVTLKRTTLDGTPYSNFALSNKITIVPQTCLVTTPHVAVNLTPPSGLSINTFTGVGSTSVPAPFTIGVNCFGVAAKVYMTLTDQQTPTNTSSILNLTSTSTVKGVGIQVLYAGKVIRFGPDSSVAGNPNQFAVFTSDGLSPTTTDINLSARYIQTDKIITPGKIANGIATFTMSYQ
jgi:type 1 fimbria pilin